MINPKSLTPLDLEKRVIYRADNGVGAAEYATLKNWDNRRLMILVDGDRTLTEAYPYEVSFATHP